MERLCTFTPLFIWPSIVCFGLALNFSGFQAEKGLSKQLRSFNRSCQEPKLALAKSSSSPSPSPAPRHLLQKDIPGRCKEGAVFDWFFPTATSYFCGSTARIIVQGEGVEHQTRQYQWFELSPMCMSCSLCIHNCP